MAEVTYFVALPFVATDDGSVGHRGLVTELLSARLDRTDDEFSQALTATLK